MNYVAIDTSGKTLLLSVSKNGKLYEYCDPECGVRHSVSIMTQLEILLDKAEMKVSDADFFAVVVGAGSFTGIRIGVSTVKALCFASGKPCLSITSFDCLAYNKTEGKTLSVLDAGHGGFYVCGYQDKRVVIPPSYILKDELIALSKEYNVLSDKPIDGMDVVVADLKNGLTLAIADKLDDVTADLNSLVPVYVRKSQAEEGR